MGRLRYSWPGKMGVTKPSAEQSSSAVVLMALMWIIEVEEGMLSVGREDIMADCELYQVELA